MGAPDWTAKTQAWGALSAAAVSLLALAISITRTLQFLSAPAFPFLHLKSALYLAICVSANVILLIAGHFRPFVEPFPQPTARESADRQPYATPTSPTGGTTVAVSTAWSAEGWWSWIRCR